MISWKGVNLVRYVIIGLTIYIMIFAVHDISFVDLDHFEKYCANISINLTIELGE